MKVPFIALATDVGGDFDSFNDANSSTNERIKWIKKKLNLLLFSFAHDFLDNKFNKCMRDVFLFYFILFLH